MIEYCLSQTLQLLEACILSAAVSQMAYVYQNDHGGTDYSEQVIAQERWVGDCEDLVVTVAALLKRAEPDMPMFVVSCPGDPGHALLWNGEYFMDDRGLHSQVPGDRCRIKALTQLQKRATT